MFSLYALHSSLLFLNIFFSQLIVSLHYFHTRVFKWFTAGCLPVLSGAFLQSAANLRVNKTADLLSPSPSVHLGEALSLKHGEPAGCVLPCVRRKRFEADILSIHLFPARSFCPVKAAHSLAG